MASIFGAFHPQPQRRRQQQQQQQQHRQQQKPLADQDTTDGAATTSATSDDAADWLEYGAAELHRRRRSYRPARYSVEAEFMQPPGWISRTPEGKFVLEDTRRLHPSPIYFQARPPSAYPPSPVVESGVYRIGGDRTDRPRPTPILRREFHSPTRMDHLHRMPPSMAAPAGRRDVGLRSSSPGPGLLLSPALTHFSDVSSVRQPGSAERSFPTTIATAASHSQANTPSQDFNRFFPNAAVLSPSVSQSRYIRELPSLLPLHQQLPSMMGVMMAASPVTIRTEAEVHTSLDPPRRPHIQGLPPPPLPARPPADLHYLLKTDLSDRHSHSIRPPPFRPPPPPPHLHHQQRLPYTISYPPPPPSVAMGLSQRPLATSSPPRSRHPPAVAVDEQQLRRKRSPLTIAVRTSGHRPLADAHHPGRSGVVEYSPQSQSSSSGFDSKNTSQQNQSSQSGSASGQSHLIVPDTSTSSVQWTSPAIPARSALESHYVNWPVKKSASAAAPPPPLPVRLSLLDASVDNHYEFDTTQSPNETGLITTATAAGPSAVLVPPPLAGRDTDPAGASQRRAVVGKLTARYENIEARVQAMKEEFQEYRKRRARGLLESAC